MNTPQKLASFVKLEHSLFSLPLLFAGALLAPSIQLNALPWGKLALIVVAGVGARTAALALNRLIDRQIDAKNPRTKDRELPSGALGLPQARLLIISGALVYLLAAAALGKLCLLLSPIPLIVFTAYPLLKRYTFMAHFGVGLGLALAPLGGYVAVAGSVPHNAGPGWLAGFTLCWVTGFDILYATLDEEFDRKEGLHSIPANFGKAAAQDLALMMHALAFFCLTALRWTAFAEKPSSIWLALIPVGSLLFMEQRYGYSLDAKSPFFKVNAWVGVAAFVYVLAGIW